MQRSRRLIASVCNSIMLYAAPIWHQAFNCVSYFGECKSAYRISSLRVCSAYRTVSYDASCVISSRVPLDILADKVAAKWRQRGQLIPATVQQSEMLFRWQEQWDRSPNGRWTYELIPLVDAWVNRKHGEIDFYLTQLISGHGCFRDYLHKYKHVDTPFCLFCPEKVENARHILTECIRFDDIRSVFGPCELSPERFINYMLQNKSNWEKAANFAAQAMKRLRFDDEMERRRRST